MLKLVAFSISLAVAPLSTYFLSEKYVWDGTHGPPFAKKSEHKHVLGNSTYAALSAVLAANLVLVAYIAASVRDDTTAAAAKIERQHVAAKSAAQQKPETKKDQ